MRKNLLMPLISCCFCVMLTVQSGLAQPMVSDTLTQRISDTVTITTFGKQVLPNIPFNIDRLNIGQLQQQVPRLQLMNQLQQLPSISIINSGSGINKPVIRGLSFNHVQLFAQGARIDHQTWDDRHDIGISELGVDKAEIVNGPAALVFGPNTMGGALIFSESPPAYGEKTNGYLQLGAFSNSVGGNLKAGVRGSKNDMYYTLHAGAQVHTNYVQGGEVDSLKPLAFNSKFTNMAFKGTVGLRKSNRRHQLTYSLYEQLLGIIEDESLEAVNNPGKKEERDYEMEAPYQNVQTHVLSTENTFYTSGQSEWTVNASYQFNNRKEFEPDTLGPKSKFLGVGLNLKTITAGVEWATGKLKKGGLSVGAQGFYQNNKNTGNWVLVPDAHIATAGGYAVGHYNTGSWNFLAGVRIDVHQLKMFRTSASKRDTLNPPIARPQQELNRSYTPLSFSAGLVYHAGKQLTIKANLASGYTAPNYAQLTAFGMHEGTYRFEVGDNRLDMEKNIEGDLTLQWNNENISASLNGYLNYISDYIFIAPTPDSAGPLRVYRWMQHDAEIKGAELNVELHPAASWFAGYIRASAMKGVLTGNAGNLPYIPSGKIITGITWKNNRSVRWVQPYITLQAAAYSSQKNVAAFETRSPGYVVTDIYAGVTPPLGADSRWKFVLFCNNVFNVDYFNHLSLIKTIGVKEPGRNIGLQATYSF